MEANKNSLQKSEHMDIQMNEHEKAQMKRRVSCNYVAESGHRIQKEGNNEEAVKIGMSPPPVIKQQ